MDKKIALRIEPLIILSVFLASRISLGKEVEKMTIYKNEENKSKIMAMYDGKLTEWPVPYEAVEVRTKYGSTNIIASGPDTAPSIILVPAMGVTATMWLPNIEALSSSYRVYAIDIIGDLGKSELYALDYYPKTGKDYNDWLREVVTELGVEKTDVIAASLGGWIAMNFTIHSPDKVNHLILLGPMGLKANTFKVISKLTKIILNPSQKNKAELTHWLLGDNEEVNDALSDYLNTAMNCEGRIGVPKRISKSELKRIGVPTLLILGGDDNPIGSPIKNQNYAEKAISDISVEILANTGHLMNVERPAEINRRILEFLNESK
ncbi:alpha/beta hydrolase [candidate division WOR-3 bacterium]|nr:alpha/beta hydrolase [candidate division WOR-3 bacterium]